MCQLQKLDCYVCKAKLMQLGQYELDENNSETYAIQPCNYLLELLKEMKDACLSAKHKGRFHCPDIQWPPGPSVTPIRHICEDCLCSGFFELQASPGYSEFQANPVRKPGPPVRKPKIAVLINCRRARFVTPSSDEDEDDDRDPDHHLPEIFRLIPSAEKKLQILELYQTDFGPVSRANGWTARQVEHSHRLLTVFIPHCNLCKTPTVMPERTVEETDAVWLADVEFEPNSQLWKWLSLSATWNSRMPLQFTIRSGFVTKPCDTCIDKENSLRVEISDFLKKNGRFNWISWMVFSWLMSRGTGNIPMFEHATMNVGFPNTQPPTLKEMLSLMAESWKRVSGVSWQHVCEFRAPASCAMPTVMHEKPFISLEQWPEWQPGVPLTIQHTLPSLVGNLRNFLVPKIFSGGFATENRGKKRKAGCDLDSSAAELGPQRKFLCEIRNNPILLADVERISGVSSNDLRKALTAVGDSLATSVRHPYSGSFQLNYPPAQVQDDNATKNSHVGSTDRSGKASTGHQSKGSLSVFVQANKAANALVTIEGAYIDEETNVAVLKESPLERTPGKPVDASNHSMNAARDSEKVRDLSQVFLRTQIDSQATSAEHKFELGDVVKSDGSRLAKCDKIDSQLQMSNHYPAEQASAPKDGKLQKHVTFAGVDEDGTGDGNMFRNCSLGDDAPDGNQVGDAANMRNNELGTLDLRDDENAAAQCNLGHAHVLEIGKFCSAPGELVFLALGSYRQHTQEVL